MEEKILKENNEINKLKNNSFIDFNNDLEIDLFLNNILENNIDNWNNFSEIIQNDLTALQTLNKIENKSISNNSEFHVSKLGQTLDKNHCLNLSKEKKPLTKIIRLDNSNNFINKK